MGRNPKLDDVVDDANGKTTRADLILQALRTGVSIAAACHFANVHEATYYRWMQGKGPRYREFREDVDRARAACELALMGAAMEEARGGTVVLRKETDASGKVVRTIEEKSRPDGRLALEILSRINPERFGRRQALEVGPPGSAGIGEPGIDDVEARRLAAGFERWRLARAGGEQESIEPPPPAPEDDDVTDAEIVDDDQEED